MFFSTGKEYSLAWNMDNRIGVLSLASVARVSAVGKASGAYHKLSRLCCCLQWRFLWQDK
jgi:hypothetical protein